MKETTLPLPKTKQITTFDILINHSHRVPIKAIVDKTINSARSLDFVKGV